MRPTRINTIIQSAFFKLIRIIPEKKAIEFVKDAAKKTYGRKGEDVIKKNCDAIDAGANGVIKVNVPAEWKKIKLSDKKSQSVKGNKEIVKFVNLWQKAINGRQGDNLPVSAFMDYADGAAPSGTSAHEKRGIAVKVLVWNADNYIEYNFCSMVCPHAVIRPVVLDEKQLKSETKGMVTKAFNGMDNYKFAIIVSTYD